MLVTHCSVAVQHESTGIPFRTQTWSTTPARSYSIVGGQRRSTCRVERLTRAKPEEAYTVTSYQWQELPQIRSYSDATWNDAEDQEQP